MKFFNNLISLYYKYTNNASNILFSIEERYNNYYIDINIDDNYFSVKIDYDIEGCCVCLRNDNKNKYYDENEMMDFLHGRKDILEFAPNILFERNGQNIFFIYEKNEYLFEFKQKEKNEFIDLNRKILLFKYNKN